MSVRSGKTRGPGSTPEATLFHQAQQGDRLALNQLMVRHEGLVHAVLRRYGSGSLTYAEALQAGRIGLWQALLHFDPHREFAFSSYAWPSIMRHLRRTAKTDRHPRPCGPPRGPRPALAPSDLTARLETEAVQQALYALVHRLAPRRQQLLLAHYGLGEHAPSNFAQLGRTLGVSRERVRQLHQEALRWLRQPAHSQTLRSLLGRHTPADYEKAETLSRRRPRPRRGRHAA